MKPPRQFLVRIVATLGLAIAPMGCTAVATEPAGDADVQAVAVRTGSEATRIAVTNRTSQPVFTIILGRNASALVLWGACADAAQCPSIAPGATRVQTPEGIDGTAETEAVVHWWHAVRGADGVMRPDSIRSFVVKL